jgi:MFS transporter, FHS family, L-fucose permease
MKKNNLTFALILTTSLFFLWGFALNLNPILIPHLKKACQLTDTESALIDSASYIAYFLMAIPAGLFIKRFSYKAGIVLGLLLFASGAFLFFPAAEVRSYSFFLAALFIIACGLTFLETAANPYITLLGDADRGPQRLNFAQSFNGLAATLAPLAGGLFILSGKTLTSDEVNNMPTADLETYLSLEASAVQVPFLVIGAVVLFVAFLVAFAPLAEPANNEKTAKPAASVLKEKNLMLGVLAQFFYVGAQVCVSSFFIRFAHHVAGLGEKTSAYFLSAALLGFMIGRFSGTFFMKFVRPARLLAIYAVINLLLLIFAASVTGISSVYALIAVEFFMSIMFPTIFSLSIRGLGQNTKIGSSLVIMSIVGGAIFPIIMGNVSDHSNIQVSYLVPALCFVVVFYFAVKNLNTKTISATTAAHTIEKTISH